MVRCSTLKNLCCVFREFSTKTREREKIQCVCVYIHPLIPKPYRSVNEKHGRTPGYIFVFSFSVINIVIVIVVLIV